MWRPSWTPSWITPLCPTSGMSTQVFFNLLWVLYRDQESKLGDIWLHIGPPSAPGLEDVLYHLCGSLERAAGGRSALVRRLLTSRRPTLPEVWSSEKFCKWIDNSCPPSSNTGRNNPTQQGRYIVHNDAVLLLWQRHSAIGSTTLKHDVIHKTGST